MKRTISILLSLCFVLTFFVPILSFPAFAKTSGDWQYSVSNGEAEITGYTGSGGDVVIPDTLGGYPVTNIGYEAFCNCTNLTSITIPDSVTSIESYAFRGCTGLSSITIGDSVTSIGYGAFYNCTNLTSITIPDSVTSIGTYAFYGCTSLSSIKIGNSVTSIEYGTFYNCISLNAATIGSGVTSIGERAFYGCTGLTFITIPDGVTSIGFIAFGNCYSIASITIPDSVTSIGSSAFGNTAWYNNQPNGLVYAGKVAYKYKGTMPANTQIILREDTKGIADSAFSGRTNLTSITIPDSVTSIGDHTFEGCTKLVYLLVAPGSYAETYAQENGFNYHYEWEYDISDDEAAITAYYGVGGDVLIPSTLGGCSVTAIGADVFKNNVSIVSVTIPDSVTSIGDSAFYSCTSLSSINVDANNPSYSSTDGVLFNKEQTTLIACPVGKTGAYTIPDGVTSIGDSAFYSCTGLTSITIPDSVTSIGNHAFSYCYNLSSITIPDSVTSIGDDAFYNCTNLTLNVTQGSGAQLYAEREGLRYINVWEYDVSNGEATITKYNGTDTDLVIPSTLGGYPVTSIGGYAFRNCSNLTSVTVPDSVTSIGYQAFCGCTGLNAVIIGNGVTSIGDRAFERCNSLSSITIPDGVTSIGYMVFELCTSLTSITIPGRVTSIGRDAFAGCKGLTSITIPDSVTSIGLEAFIACNNLTIYGFAGTYAESYANSHSIVFQPIFTPGDIKLDGQVDVRDLNEFLYLFNSNLHLNPNADCNADGSINLSDATLLAKYLAGWNVALGVANPVDPVASSAAFSLDPVTVPEGENVISVPVRISGLTDADDLGAVQLNIGYDKTKLKLIACHIAQDEQYDADFFETVSMTNPTQANGNFSLIALTTQTSNPNWASDYEFNDYPFVVLEFEVLGLWADTVPLTLTGTALRRSDDAFLQVSYENGTLTSGIHVSKVELDVQELSVIINGSTMLTPTIAPANATVKDLTWSSSDSAVATVSNGLVIAKKPGTATITVTTVDGGFAATCAVTVYCEHNPAQTWTIDSSEHWHSCSICGGKVDAASHTLVENADEQYLKSEATCFSPAIFYKSCAVCGGVSNETFESGTLVPHDYRRVDAYSLKCSVCDHIKRFGDLNGDSNYTGADVNALVQIVTDGADDVSGQADTNFDSVIDVSDMLLLAKKIAGWNVNLGENTAPTNPVASSITVSADEVQIEADAQTVTVPIRLSGVTDADDLGALQIELSYDATKLQPVSAYCTTGTGRNKVSYGADIIGNFTTSGAGADPYCILTWNTSTANLNLDSAKQINSKEYAFVTFNVLGIWGGNTPVNVSATAIRRSDGASLETSVTNGSVTREEPTRVTGISLDQQNANLVFETP